MRYQAVANRCAVNSHTLPRPTHQSLAILADLGFVPVEVSFASSGRELIGVSHYRLGAPMHLAPMQLDCSGFVKYLYAQRGIWLPRRAIQQRACGQTIATEQLAEGDLIFTSGQNDYYEYDPDDGVGHVGIMSSPTHVMQALRNADVIETPLANFTRRPDKLRGCRRIVSQPQATITLTCPTRYAVETSDDLRWIVHQHLPKS